LLNIIHQSISRANLFRLGYEINPEKNVLVTSGGTEALNSVIQGLTLPGDEVVSFEPSFPATFSMMELAGVKNKGVPMKKGTSANGREIFEMDLEALEASITDKTRIFYHINPHNPTGIIKLLKA
jgi:N-succinyldiaminopimelate aminotransferase